MGEQLLVIRVQQSPLFAEGLRFEGRDVGGLVVGPSGGGFGAEG